MTTPVTASADSGVEAHQSLVDRLPAALGKINFLFAGLVLAGIGTSWWKTGTYAQLATVLEWMLASLLAGAAIGFLFGIPKILQGDAAPRGTPDVRAEGQQNYRQQVNTNLTEISDWLTKIIVGLGLINLEKAPGKLRHIASVVATGIDGRPQGGSEAFVIALIVSYSTLGFLFGYISTRLFLAGAFSKADQAWEEVVIKQRVEIAANQSAIASLTSSTEVLKQALYPAAAESSPAAPPASRAVTRGGPPVSAQGHDQGDVSAELMQEANDYLKIKVPDYSERLRLKDLSANRMANLLLKSTFTRDQLVDLIRKEGNQGLVLALATIVNLRPEPGDFTKLATVAHGISRLHVRYRVLVAVGELIRKRLVNEADLPQVRALLDEYQIGADQSLAALIRSTRVTIDKQPHAAP